MRQGTHRIVPVKRCLIEDERASRIIQTIVELLPAFKLRVYNEYTGRGFLRHVLIRTGWHTGEILVVLVAVQPGVLPAQARLCGGRCWQRHPEITSLVLNQSTTVTTSMVPGPAGRSVLFGPGYHGGRALWQDGSASRRNPFIRSMPEQAERPLRKRAIGAAPDLPRRRKRCWMPTAASGTIGLCASDHIRAAHWCGAESRSRCGMRRGKRASATVFANAEVLSAQDAGRFMTAPGRSSSRRRMWSFMDPPRGWQRRCTFLRSRLARWPPSGWFMFPATPNTLARDVAVL